jgi:DinB family protein
MNQDQALRQHLVELLTSEHAHAGFESAVKDIPKSIRGARPAGMDHSPWELLEHLRIAQWDILEFSRDAKHVSPDFPSGYWPKSPAPESDAEWDKSVNAFRRDLSKMVALIKDAKSDLFARIPHGSGQTLLREALLVADHNAYHLGQFVQLRKLLDAWK